MTTFIQQLLNALSLGSEYALLALGLALVFSIMGFVNFAHGELITVAGYAMFAAKGLGLPAEVLLLVGILAAVIASLLMERIAFAPVRDAPASAGLLTSFGISLIIQSGIILFVATRPKGVPTSSAMRTVIHLGDLTIPLIQVLETVVTIVALLALGALLKRTQLGLAMRAAAHDLDTVRLMGINPTRVISTAFALAGAFAGLAAVFIITRRGSVDAFMGSGPVIKAFVAVVLGGVGGLKSAVGGGFLLGISESLASAYLPDALKPFRDVFVFLGVGLILVIRPQGLFSRAKDFHG